MAAGHTDDGEEKGNATDDSEGLEGASEDGQIGGASRRSLLKGAAATAATLGAVGVSTNGAAAQESLTLSPDGEVTLDPGEYTWSGEDLDIGSNAALVGGGTEGDVVLNLESGTMQGTVEGTLENVVVRGANPSSKAGIDLPPGATVDGFVWPEGGQQSEDRAFYSPEGGDERVTLRNSAWGFMANNGAYLDKPPVTIENCAAVNNNIAGIRIGHRDGTSSGQTTHVRNSLIAVTADIPNDDTNTPNARGVRIRHPGDIVIEDSYFIYLDVDGAANPIEVHDGAAGASVTIRNCTFYNDSDQAILRDKSGGSADVTVENCVAVGSGSMEFEAGGVSESDLAADGDVSFPLPSDVTGYPSADEIEGVGSGIGPWDGSVSVDTATEEEEEPADPAEYDHVLALHGSPDNPVSSSAKPGDFDLDVTVSGSATLGEHAESGSDSIVENDDGTSTINVNNLGPDELDSFRFDGEVVDFVMDDGYEVDLSLDGTTMTPDELVDGTSGGDSSGDDSSGDDSSAGDSADDDSSGDDSTSEDDAHPHLLTVAGEGDVTQYTFTVSGDVGRDSDASVVADDSTPWDRMKDIARDGKVIGVVGNGTDGYRFSGHLTALTVDGDADVTIERDA
ncbi:hypothetical protein HUG10_16595 [Halorarum halophilum]|uniref:Right handed beta helix domain-containing protein n=1 Tax=Halorarum halophilum TaxID=2743090 RepID=A0A7D5KHC9_9EURY|nr:right-handed parallel beta-helix repeat-containing protein [Halobaculum halophilum]QLG29056.1 hypothetical protein HUG10_16595 [Halobaculum halophilum]